VRSIPKEVQKILSDKLKVGDKKVTVRVEVDKLAFNPTLSTEFDLVKFYGSTISPDIIAGGYSNNITSAAFINSPIKGKSVNDIMEKLTSNFGESRGDRLHKGTDFAYPPGTEVVASADGIVTHISTGSLKYVSILHANGFRTRYLHLGDIYVKEGTVVTQGQTVAVIGETDAYSTGPHLHFEVLTGADKQTLGTAVDAVPYLQKNSFIVDVPNHSVTASGTVSPSSAADTRIYPSHDSPLDVRLDPGTSVDIVSYVGEWLGVSVGDDVRYVHKSHVSIDFDLLGSEGDASSGNPNLLEVANYIRSTCSSRGLPFEIGLAIAWTESGWNQFNSDGSPLGSSTGDWGIMQINESAHPGAFPGVKEDWKANVRYGVNYAFEKFVKAKNTYQSTHDIARATYSAYNTGSDYSRWEDTVDQRDVNFYDHYTNTPWMSELGGTFTAGGGDLSPYIFGVANKLCSIREGMDISSDPVVSIGSGMLVTIVNSTGDWYEVVLTDGRKGYVEKDNINIMDGPLSIDLHKMEVFNEDFSKYTPFATPPRYAQDATNRWKVDNDGNFNVLRATGGGVGEYNTIDFIIDIPYSGKLDIEAMVDMALGNNFIILDNGNLIYNKTDALDDDYSVFSIPLIQGTHVIKLVRDKHLSGNATVSIKSIKAYNFTKMGNESGLSDSFSNLSTNVQFLNQLTVLADKVGVYTEPDVSSQLIFEASRGMIYPCQNGVVDNWVEVRLEDGGSAYIFYKQGTISIKKGGFLGSNLSFNTGGFSYERTLVLDNVLSVDIDFKDDMRASSATVTIENFMGYYSPDARFNYFSDAGIIKSPFVDYDEGSPWGVLTDNTPIRIYLGYGDDPPRKFTGLIDTVDVDGEGSLLVIKCTDMMKKLVNYANYTPLNYPPDGDLSSAWLVSSVIHDLAKKGGMDTWRITEEDLMYPDIVVEETIYVDVNKVTGKATKFDELGQKYEVDIESLPADSGYVNPYLWYNKTIQVGTSIADAIEEICTYVNYWQRCDYFGTYWCTPSKSGKEPVIYFRDTAHIISLNKTIDYSNCRNHLIITGGGSEDHFMDNDLWRVSKGERRSASVVVPWADSYGKKVKVAEKMFFDMKKKSRTLQVVIEGHPYLELKDAVGIEHKKTSTMDVYIVKGIRDSWTTNSGYLTYLDLYWLGGNV